MGKRMNWERAKRVANLGRDRTNKDLESRASEILKGNREARLSPFGGHRYTRVAEPKFKHTHVIYNDGRGDLLYKVDRVVRKTKDGVQFGPELVVLFNERTGLCTKEINATAVRGAKVVKPKA
jgi:hypothetical protein